MDELRHTIGVDIGGTNLRAGVVADDGTVIFRATAESRGEESGENIRTALVTVVAEIENYCGNNSIRPESMGIGAPGTINPYTCTVLGAADHLPGWEGTDLRALLAEHTPCRVFADNDANVAVLGEVHFGACKGMRDVIAITLGTGVGGGIMVNGQLLHGAHFLGGESVTLL